MIANRITRNKKATIFSALVVFILVAVFAYGSVQMMAKRNTLELQIGERQFELLDVYGKGENALFFVDAAAKESMKEAANHLVVKLKSDCGGYWGEDYYDNKCVLNTRTCFPSETEINKRFVKDFKSKLEFYVSGFNMKNPQMPITLPSYYEARTADGRTEIVGIADENERINVNLPEISYSVKTSFKQQMDVAVISDVSVLISVMQQIFENKIKDINQIKALLHNAGFSDSEIIGVNILTSPNEECIHPLGNEACEVCDDTGFCASYSEKEIAYYDPYTTIINVKSKEKMFIYKSVNKIYEFSNIYYSFLISRIEEKDREITCET